MKLPDDPITIGTFLLALGGNCVWALLFFANSIKRKYAAERDFGHIKNNLKDLTNNLEFLFKELDRRLDSQDRDLSELKSYLIGKAIRRDREHEEG
ncbi:hypothetical protein [Halotia branconii]|uniref:Uncharacterized protein n=1 Tax=Halotia branconii CENA392 TaxID=1539056 RepID=A0AAJ6NND3_9CYAN|nr:hypothetical protein [Halotia branconii]WGV23704.1 hypothetical protein QI031_18025 [Halotia branconii CENA392]